MENVKMSIADAELEHIRLESARRAQLRAAGFVAYEIIKSAFYFISFLPLFVALHHFRSAHPSLLLVLVIASFYLAGAVFLTLLVLARRLVVGNLEGNQVISVESALGKRFFFAAMLNEMFLSSPFRSMVSGLSPLTPYYFRGMGAKMATSVFINPHTWIADPWFVEIQENATIGGDALIMGHAGDGPRITLGSVFIGEGAVIGARCVLFPNVRVGSHARVGVGAVVVGGTVIPDGETWAGIPARRISAQTETASS
jgi:acetyltransferase-like isoleucine patch superfamily enzyme